MSLPVKTILRFILFVLFQALVLDKVLLFHLITPYLYFLFLLWLPFKINRALLMGLGFLLGFAIDSFRHNPGFHAAACVLIAYLRPFLINLLIPQEGADSNYEAPSFKSLGGIPRYMVYAGILCTIHNLWLFILMAWQFGNIWYLLAKTILSTLLSLLMIFIVELLFSRKQRYRTNT